MSPEATYKNTQFIKEQARQLGFDFCGIAKAEFLEEQAPLLEKWLKNNYHGEMHYMANHFDKRLDPRLLVEGSKSVVSLLLNYFPPKPLEGKKYKISSYAYGKDYHSVIKEKLFQLIQRIKEHIGDVQGRAFVDSAPMMDKVWAHKAGLGWIGKHTNLIHKQSGSWFFIAELVIDLELVYDTPAKDHCGSCTRCIDACPTEAITEPYVVDGSKCISYATIELKNAIPEAFKGKMEHWIFGCDICQDVCPWNRFSVAHQTPEFMPNEVLEKFKDADWEELTEEVFNQLAKDSPFARAKFNGLKRNIVFVQDSEGA